MLKSMVPDREPVSTQPADVAPLAWALERMPDDLWTPVRDVEKERARRLAAEDIFHELLAEYASEHEGGDR